MSELRITNRCPQCRGGTFMVSTTIQMSTTRDFVDGKQTFGPVESGLHDDIASHGSCGRCGHQWKFRSTHLNYIDDEDES